jgi:hypothetical protein
MKMWRFSEEQIALILRKAEEETTVEEVLRKTGISQGRSSAPSAGNASLVVSLDEAPRKMVLLWSKRRGQPACE